ncbi:hypothetical protein [Halobacillus massiliensis]|nr:hypothetical protein [Halobacillus massiliensis]
MFQIYLVLLLLGAVIGSFAWCRKRGGEDLQHSWLVTYLSD